MKKLKMILLSTLMIGILQGCSVLELIQPKQVPMINKPDVEVFYSENRQNVCFTKEDATEYFLYVNNLETIIEDAQ